LANALSPKWTLVAVRIGAGENWLRRYTDAAPWATREFAQTD
jgi:hypothetical protein